MTIPLILLHGALGSAALSELQATCLGSVCVTRDTEGAPQSRRRMFSGIQWAVRGALVGLEIVSYELPWSFRLGRNGVFDAEKIASDISHFAQQLSDLHAPLDWKVLCRNTADFLQNLGAGQGIPQAAYAAINCPVHIGWGDADQVVSLEECQNVVDWLPNEHLHILA